MYLIVGLGNPGAKYARTHHNAGFDVVELLSHKLNAPLTRLKCKALCAETHIGAERVVLAQPQTFMNLSGQSVVELMNWYKVTPDHLIVCYDDIDLDLSALRVRAHGSAGTHNGMRSIIYLLGRDDFPRVRVGIGKPPAGWDLADYVLSGYNTPKERQMAFDGYQDAVDVIIELVENGIESATRLAAERSAKRYPKPEKPRSEAKKEGARFQIVTRHIWDRIRAQTLNGASVCVNIAGKTAFQCMCGQANIERQEKLRRNSLFRLGCMTMPVTAAAFMIQVERGRLQLDAPAEETLPELRHWHARDIGQTRRSVTARDLLACAASFSTDEAKRAALVKAMAPQNASLENVVHAYADVDLESGTRTDFSPIAGFDVLARMVEVAANLPFEEFVRLAIFEPLRMRDTTWFPTQEQWARVVTTYAALDGKLQPVEMDRIDTQRTAASYACGGAGLFSSLPDYTRFAQMLLGMGELEGTRILQEESVRMIAKWCDTQVMPKGCFGWRGEYGTHFWVDTQNALTAVYMSNMTTASAETAREFEQDVYACLKNAE